MGKLEVHQLAQEEVYLDIVKIAEQYRLRADGSSIEEGSGCSLRCSGREILVVARGSAVTERHIFLDERSRNKLGIDLARTYEFEMTTLGSWGSCVGHCKPAMCDTVFPLSFRLSPSLWGF
jgi:hypothetical protein